ncbi:F0F1 ATP synthase subunit A [Candidatus Termititenax persephonae]|uniref:ATP synthase subunit a n=1 Tax=Candidatus Termititenax persephonae TaxID=2218525 RepID=A0A388TGD9_9BACT|nr:F0F1 ATP synthase subunit A [Candidatus Termititenax persephonae]
MHEAAKVFLALRWGWLDISIDTTVLLNFCAALFLIACLFLIRRGLAFQPKGFGQNLLEAVVEFTDAQILRPAGLNQAWLPWCLSAFLYILFTGLPLGILGLLGPQWGLGSAVSNINGTAALAVLFFLVSLGVRFRQHGFWGFCQSLVPTGVRGPVVLLLFPIEVVSQLFKPFSLAIRLFANMSGGHLLLITILGFTALFNNVAVWLASYGGAIVIIFFELFVCCIQAYVFTFLGASMIGEALNGE